MERESSIETAGVISGKADAYYFGPEALVQEVTKPNQHRPRHYRQVSF